MPEIKVVVVGNTTVGKTDLIEKYVQGFVREEQDYEPTDANCF